MRTRIRTANFIFKEGLSNLFRNKLMFMASCIIVTASLIILGLFLLIIFNIDENIKSLNEKPQIQVYCRFDMPEADVDALEGLILSAPGIKEFQRISKEEAYIRAKGLLGENSAILDGFGAEFLPESFILRMGDASLIDGFVLWLEGMPEVDKVSYPKKTIDLITGVSNWAKAFGAVIAGIPILFAVFIVSNTIRLAVMERRGEIGIMRYIGATEQIIRWPFVVEGMITGAVGATIAFFATGYGYKLVEGAVSAEMVSLTDDLFRLVEIGSVSPVLLLTYALIGVGVGAVGSARSIRKYLKV